jgi:hypothetical protein
LGGFEAVAMKPRHVLCALGNWTDFEPIIQLLSQRFDDFELDEDFSTLSADARMPRAFEISAEVGSSTLTKSDQRAVASHSAVVYVLSPSMERGDAARVSGRALELVAALFELGALAIKSESAGLAHGRKRWLGLAESYRKARAAEDDHGSGAALYFAWVQRPIHDEDDGVVYSVGMHLLGEPDTEVDAKVDMANACEWIDLMGLYLAADRPTRPVKDGEGFRLSEGGARRVIRKRPCRRYEDDDFFFNPYGYHRLIPSSTP